MITVFSDQHALRNARTELYGGELVAPHESAQRALLVLERIHAVRLGEIIAPTAFGLEPVFKVHDPQSVSYTHLTLPTILLV